MPQARAKWIFPNRPQILLCDWRIKVVKPGKELPENVVMFHVPQDMTKYDIRNYLTTIYNLDIEKVATLNQLGKTKMDPVYKRLIRRKSYKKAYVYLKYDTFKFPEFHWNDEKKRNSEQTLREAEQERLERALTLNSPGFD